MNVYRLSMDIFISNLGDQDATVGICYAEMATCYMVQGQNEDALLFFENALLIMKGKDRDWYGDKDTEAEAAHVRMVASIEESIGNIKKL